MGLGTDDSRAPYVQVAELLKERIIAGEFPAGGKLPPTRELAEHYGVAQNTVLSAIRVLRDEGIVSSQQGRGTFVRAVPEPGGRQLSPEIALVMRQLEEFQSELRSMRGRLEHLEQMTEKLLDEDAPPTR
jgi:DNA-binding GntR family transcriptional regulator